MSEENSTPETEVQWQALRYISGEMLEEEVSQFEERLAADDAACQAVATAVQTSLAVRLAFETQVAQPELPASPETPHLRPARIKKSSSRGARWVSLITSAAAVVVVLSVAQFREPDTVFDHNRELAVLWTQAADVLPVDLPESHLDEESTGVSNEDALTEAGEDRLPPVDLVDVPEWLLVALESQQGQPGDEENILEN